MVAAESNILNKDFMLFLKGNDILGFSSVGCNAFYLTSSSKLAVPTSTEKIKLTSFSDDACMTATARDLGNLFVESKFSWLIKVLLISMTELTIVSITPSEDFTFIGKQSRVLFAASEV